MASHAQDYLEVTIERHYTDIKELMTNYQKLILENQMVLEELEMECQEKINEDMAYALSYLSIFNHQLDVAKMHREMNNYLWLVRYDLQRYDFGKILCSQWRCAE